MEKIKIKESETSENTTTLGISNSNYNILTSSGNYKETIKCLEDLEKKDSKLNEKKINFPADKNPKDIFNSDEILKIVCISDTHNLTEKLRLPKGDMLIHAGDFSIKGRINEINHFAEFMRKQDFKYKIIIAGNHDLSFDERIYKKKISNLKALNGKIEENILTPKEAKELLSEFIYLENSGVEIFGIKIFGSPFADSPKTDGAFIIPSYSEKRKTMWNIIPDDIDILITHGPPYGICDFTKKNTNSGCKYLLEQIKARIKPKYHIFGHIHEANGRVESDNITFINCAICLKKNPTNKFHVFYLNKKNVQQSEPKFFERKE